MCTIFMSQDHSTLETLSHFLLSFSAVWFQCTQWMPLCYILPPVQTDICLWVWEWSCTCIQCPDNQHAGWTQVCQILSLMCKNYSFQQMYIKMYRYHHFNGVTFEVNELSFWKQKENHWFEVHLPILCKLYNLEQNCSLFSYLFKTWWCLCYRQHRGKIIGLAFSPVGDYLYSACSLGSLSLYDAESDRYTLLRLLANTVVRTDRLGPEAIAVSPDGRRVAFIGPSEFTVCVVDAKSLSEVSWILLFKFKHTENL